MLPSSPPWSYRAKATHDTVRRLWQIVFWTATFLQASARLAQLGAGLAGRLKDSAPNSCG